MCIADDTKPNWDKKEKTPAWGTRVQTKKDIGEKSADHSANYLYAGLG